MATVRIGSGLLYIFVVVSHGFYSVFSRNRGWEDRLQNITHFVPLSWIWWDVKHEPNRLGNSVRAYTRIAPERHSLNYLFVSPTPLLDAARFHATV